MTDVFPASLTPFFTPGEYFMLYFLVFLSHTYYLPCSFLVGKYTDKLYLESTTPLNGLHQGVQGTGPSETNSCGDPGTAFTPWGLTGPECQSLGVAETGEQAVGLAP